MADGDAPILYIPPAPSVLPLFDARGRVVQKAPPAEVLPTEDVWCPLPGAPSPPALSDPHDRGEYPERRFRLFLCAGCRALWERPPDPETRRAVEVAERYADGEASEDELFEARTAASRLAESLWGSSDMTDWIAEQRYSGVLAAVHAAGEPGRYYDTGIYDGSTLFEHTRLYKARYQLHHALTGGDPDESTCPQLNALWRDISGGAWRATPFDHEWRTSDVLALARRIYTDQAFDLLPILADALQDAGCSDGVMLIHCRGPFTHTRGCWVVDSILDKE